MPLGKRAERSYSHVMNDMSASRRTGSVRKNPYYSGPVSDHFDGHRFFNPGGEAPRGGRDLLRWMMSERRSRWPSRAESPFGGMRPAPRIDDLRVTMVGHATLLIQIAGVNILTDPVWSDRASPFQFAGPRRVVPPGIAFDDLPPIDLVLVSHNHYDHLDLITLRRLHAAHAPQVVTPLGNDTLMHRAIPGIKATAHDWGEAVRFGPLTIHLDPCHHWSARGTRDRSMALWASFTIETPAGKVLFIGDTGYDNGRPYEVLQRHGSLRLAILPVGAYEPRWFMKAQHQDPAEAVAGFLQLDARAAIGHHWGTFQLTNEARQDPVDALAVALSDSGVAPERFRALQAGEVWE